MVFLTMTIYEMPRAGRCDPFSPLPIPPAQEQSDSFLQICIWDGNCIIALAVHVTDVITRPSLDETYTTLWFSTWLNVSCILTYRVDAWYYCSNFLQTSGKFKLALTVTVLSQNKQLTRCTSHLKTNFLCDIKDTHREKPPSNKTPALTKSIILDIWVVGILYRLFMRGS